MAKKSAASRGRTKKRKSQQTAVAVGQLIRQDRKQNGLRREAEQLVADARALEAETTASQDKPSRQQRRAVERRQQKLEGRTLRLLERNDEVVREALLRKERLSGIMAADEATEGDELFWFIAEELKLLSVLESLAPPSTRVDEETGKEIRCRNMYPPLVLNLLGLLSRFMGLSSGPDIQAAVLCDERWMSLLGFNAAEVADGSTRRSASLIGKTREGSRGQFVDAGPLGPARARLEGPRGALSSQTLAGHESALDAEALVATFNAVVRALAERGYFSKEVRMSLDSTGEEVVPSFEDAGVVRKKVKVESKARRPRQVEVSVRGFKVWYVMEVETGLPLAMTLDTIETAETTPARALIDQARENLEGCSCLVSGSVDRGFLDGDFLWWLKEERCIDWVCPSKENMLVTAEARERVDKALAALRTEEESRLETAQRAARRGLSHEKVQFFERTLVLGRETLVVAQVDELLCTDFYGPGGSSSSRVYSKKFRPTALHATVVLRWPDRSAKDREDAKEHDPDAKGPIVLLSPVKEAALVRYDRYDERSLIENRLNRDGKQYFGLGDSLARNLAAQWSASVFSTLALTLYRAMELHREKALEHLDRRCEHLGVLRYRRQMAMQNRGRIIVVVDTLYGMFTLVEFATIAGFDVIQ